METHLLIGLKRYAKEVRQELDNILAYWLRNTYDEKNATFHHKVNKDNHADALANKGCVLGSRILWTYSAGYNFDKEAYNKYLPLANVAYQNLTNYFIDKDFGGVYWTTDSKGNPLDSSKQLYAHSFAVYGLSEYFKASKRQEVLDDAIGVYRAMEQYAFDKENLGYIDAFSRDWKPTEKLHLSHDGAKKTMNTHLHILEAYTNLYRVWKDEGLKKQLKNVIDNFLQHIIDPSSYHLILFFDEKWQPTSQMDSYGHDIECSWLLLEAAEVLGEKDLIEKVKPICVQMALAAAMGLEKDGSMRYELDRKTGHRNEDKSWWVQAEAMIGFLNAWQITGAKHFLDKSLDSWEFTKKHLIDAKNGEWYMSADNKNSDKVNLWKCPYHNGRACMEVFHRLKDKHYKLR
jgi:mannobiose 2-epimerase